MQAPLAVFKIEAQRRKDSGILIHIWLKAYLPDGSSQTVAWTYGKEVKPTGLTSNGMMQYSVYDSNNTLRAIYWAHDIEITDI